ncbi:MAG: MFS transporter, partial [Nitriliruptorales bacterium]|nr:MFS transporter [Nitriliruptorales bacterium]
MMSFRVAESTTPPESQPAQPRRAMLAAAASSMLGFLPVFLVAAQGVLVRGELNFNEARLGIAVSVFFATGAAMSAPGGRVSERLGPRIGMLTTAGAIAVLLVLIAVTVHSWATLVVFMALAGAVNAVAQTSGDISVARGVPERVQGFAFGVKTSCLPLATLFAGVAIPAVGVHFGWRVSFLVAVGVAAAVAGLVPRASSFRPAQSHRATAPGPTPSPSALLVLAIAGALSIGAVNTMGAFYAESALRLDLSPSAAGWWLAFGSLLAVLARVGFGAFGDRSERGHLALVIWLWVAGGIG